MHHFGQEFASELLALEPSSAAWRGPVRSAYGYHLVLLLDARPPSLPELADVRERVAADFERAEAREAELRLVQSLKSRYRVEVADDVTGEEPRP